MRPSPESALTAVVVAMVLAVLALGLYRSWWEALTLAYCCVFALADIARLLGLAEDPHADCEPGCDLDHCC
ncbi:hypothetical protein ABZ234_07840 [Nocardiopsis sp. NPDC006198]|uniref:hypothetical protein n=1 Tax=Nocardiopsis sp. NPDC006198 TaxID=3154472 RepID=UPI0033BCEAB1